MRRSPPPFLASIHSLLQLSSQGSNVSAHPALESLTCFSFCSAGVGPHQSCGPGGVSACINHSPPLTVLVTAGGGVGWKRTSKSIRGRAAYRLLPFTPELQTHHLRNNGPVVISVNPLKITFHIITGTVERWTTLSYYHAKFDLIISTTEWVVDIFVFNRLSPQGFKNIFFFCSLVGPVPGPPGSTG